MMNHKELPMAEPVIKGFSHQAILLSILMAHEKCKPWICNNYLQIFTLRNLKDQPPARLGCLDFFYSEFTDFNRVEFKANPWLVYNETPMIFLEPEESVIVNRIIDCIDANLYCTLDIDKYYIPEYGNPWHVDHTIIVYGYDLKERCFLCIDNFKDGMLSRQSVKMSAFTAAAKSITQSLHLSQITLREHVPCFATFGISNYTHYFPIELDIKRMLYFLNAYIEPEKFYMSCSDNDYYVYGILAYHEIAAFWEQCFQYKKSIDIRSYYSLMDHKSLMIWRLNYIQEKRHIDLSHYIEQFQNLKDEMYNQIFILVKYNATNRIKDSDTLAKALQSSCDREYAIIFELIEYLKKAAC